MDNIADIFIEVKDHYFGGLEGLKTILNDYYENEIGSLKKEEQQLARRFLEEGLIVSGRRVGITEGVEKERYGIEENLLNKLLQSRLIRIEHTHLGKSYEISHDTLVAPIMTSYKKRKLFEERVEAERLLKEEQQKLTIEKKKRLRARAYAIAGFTLFFVALFAGLLAYQQSQKIKQVAKASDIRGLGYKTVKDHPTHALLFAEASLYSDPSNVNSKHLIRDLLNNYPSDFCSGEIWIGDYVSGLAFLPDNKHFVSGSWDGRLNMWTITGDTIFSIAAHEEAILGVAVSPDGQYILTGSADNTVKLWDQEGNQVRTIGEHLSDIHCLSITSDGNQIITGNWDSSISVWTIDGKLIHTLNGHDNVVSDLAVSPDGQFLVSTGWDAQAIIWDLSTGEMKRKISDHKNGLESVFFINNGTQFFTSTWGGNIRLWDLKGELHKEFDLEGRTAYEAILAVDKKSFFAVQGDRTVRQFDFEGRVIREFKNHDARVVSSAISEDGAYLLSGSRDYTVSVWHLDGLEIGRLKSPTNTYTIALSPDEEKVLVGGDDSIAYVLNSSGEVLDQLKGHHQGITTIACSPNGEYYATGSGDDLVIIWSADGTLKKKINSFNSDVQALTFSSDSKFVLAGGNDDEGKLFDLDGNVLLTLKGHKTDIRAVAFSEDGQYMLTGSRDATARLWNRDGDFIREYSVDDKSIYTVDISNDNKYILTGGESSTVTLWSFDGKKLATLSGHRDWITSASFSPDGEAIISSSKDGRVKIWDMQGNELQTYSRHNEKVYSTLFTPDGKYIWSADISGHLHKWMRWDAYLNSDRLMSLNQAVLYTHGLTDTIGKKPDRLSVKKEKHNKPGSAYYPNVAIEFFSSRLHKTPKEHQYYPFYIRELSKNYSIKARFATDLKEKKYYQQKGMTLIEELLSNWSYPEAPNSSYDDIMVFHHASQCIWEIIGNNMEGAQQVAAAGLNYQAQEKVKSYLDSKIALCSYYVNQDSSSKAVLMDMKDMNLYTNSGKDFWEPYVYSYGVDLDTLATMGNLILEDIDLLEKNGRINSAIEDLRKELSSVTKPHE